MGYVSALLCLRDMAEATGPFQQQARNAFGSAAQARRLADAIQKVLDPATPYRETLLESLAQSGQPLAMGAILEVARRDSEPLAIRLAALRAASSTPDAESLQRLDEVAAYCQDSAALAGFIRQSREDIATQSEE